MWQKIKNIYHLVRALSASIIFGFPSNKITVIGVTGTDGKTTTAHMIYEILKSAGKKVSLISSIYAVIGEKVFDTGFHVTTPDPIALQKFLKYMTKQKTEYAVIEVTSHSLDQNRVAGVNFEIAVLTNITHEHLDYHKKFENYLMSKSKLFKKAKISILNADDKYFANVKKNALGKTITYGVQNKADYTRSKYPIKLQIPGDYNIYNALAAAAATSEIKIDKKTILKTLLNFKGLTGRMESIDLGQNFKVIVDFAHTPNSLRNALQTLKKATDKKVIAVFGSAGERDKEKRPLMGEISAKLADFTVITSEDPRNEKVQDIALEIADGCDKAGSKKNKNYFIKEDRKDAIMFAICNLAKEGDIVGIFGKGHEKSMNYKGKEYPWSEFAQVKKAITIKIAEK